MIPNFFFSGLGSIFKHLSRFGSVFKPMISNAAKVLGSEPVKNASKRILNSGLDLAANVVADSLEGSDVKKSAKTRLEEAKKEIATVVRESRPKNKQKRKKGPLTSKTKKNKVARKSVSVDIFDDDSA